MKRKRPIVGFLQMGGERVPIRDVRVASYIEFLEAERARLRSLVEALAAPAPVGPAEPAN